MAIALDELQTLRDAAVRNKAAGVVHINFSDGRAIQYVATPDQWQKIITDLDGMIAAASSSVRPRFTLPTFSRD